MAVPTGIEPAISCVTGRRDNRYTTGPNSYSQYINSNGDPYGIRTRVTAVKGRCLNHLTNGPIKKTEQEGFEPSRRFTRPTPLAGAPLQPLEYYSNSTGRTRTCDPLINSQMLLPTELLWINICVPNEQYLLYKSINIMSILLYNFFSVFLSPFDKELLNNDISVFKSPIKVLFLLKIIKLIF